MSRELDFFSTGLSFPPQQMLSRISDHRCHRLGVSTTSNPRLLRRWIRCSSIIRRAVLDWLTSKANVSICQFYTFNRQCRNSRALSKYSKYVIPPSIAPVICFPLKMFDVSQTVYLCFWMVSYRYMKNFHCNLKQSQWESWKFTKLETQPFQLWFVSESEYVTKYWTIHIQN